MNIITHAVKHQPIKPGRTATCTTELFQMIAVTDVIQKLQTVYDPEIPVNIYDLGLIYNVAVIGTQVYITMTLTTATCPAAAFMPEEVKNVVLELPQVTDVHVDVVYEPRWTRDKMSAAAKEALGFT
jgi:metal-sulfur cluster biosynthetic enzyme